MLLEEKVWCERYRPKTLEDCLLPPATRILFNSFVEKKFVPNMLLSGQPGIGKTTAAKCVLNDIGAEHITINGSIKGNIDTLRNDIQQFASTVSYNGGKKYVILDEADNLTQATQLALRGFIEEYSANCGYIFTCNFRNKIIDAIADSRLLSEIDFTFRSNERQELAKGLFKKLTVIFTSEGVLFTPDDLKNFIVIFLNKSNDLRKLFITAQKFASSGAFVVDTITTADSRFVDLVAILKSKNFVKMLVSEYIQLFGYQSWLTYGSGYNAILDLHPDSYSMRTLYNYAQNKGVL